MTENTINKAVKPLVDAAHSDEAHVVYSVTGLLVTGGAGGYVVMIANTGRVIHFTVASQNVIKAAIHAGKVKAVAAGVAAKAFSNKAFYTTVAVTAPGTPIANNVIPRVVDFVEAAVPTSPAPTPSALFGTFVDFFVDAKEALR